MQPGVPVDRWISICAFSIRAYPVGKVPELRSGMSAYLDWRMRE